MSFDIAAKVCLRECDNDCLELKNNFDHFLQERARYTWVA